MTDTLPAGRQRILARRYCLFKISWTPYPDIQPAMEELLPLRRRGWRSPSDVAVTVRTTTALAEGRAGLAYSGNRHVENFYECPVRRLSIPVYLRTASECHGSLKCGGHACRQPGRR